MVVLAPPLFSTTNGCPSWIDSCWAMMRPMMSAVPPAPNGTMTRTGLLGQFAADCPAERDGTPNAAAPVHAAPALMSARRLCDVVMLLPPWCCARTAYDALTRSYFERLRIREGLGVSGNSEDQAV